jgi:nucleoid DNA-binding protein
MGKPIGFTELMKRLAVRAKLSDKTVRKVYDNLFLLASEELRFCGTVKLKRFGTFTLKQRGGRDKNVPRPDGSVERVYIEPYYTIKFKPTAEFINYANGRMTEKESRKRMKNGTLTKSDKNLLNYNTDDRERNLEMALEKIAEEIKYGKR